MGGMSPSSDMEEELAMGPLKEQPRPYQAELIAEALKVNALVSLGTGAGKTLIAAEVLRRRLPGIRKRGQVAVFLAPTNPLVEQQHMQLVQKYGLRSAPYHGANAAASVAVLGAEGWEEKWRGLDVLVMTPDALLHVLAHGYMSLRDCGLLLFDEAHHCGGNHPYAQIMEDYWAAVPPGQRPPVLALTASPEGMVPHKKRGRPASRGLQGNLNALVLTASDRDGVERYVHVPSTVLLPYEEYAAPPLVDDALRRILTAQEMAELVAKLQTTEQQLRKRMMLHEAGLLPGEAVLQIEDGTGAAAAAGAPCLARQIRAVRTCLIELGAWAGAAAAWLELLAPEAKERAPASAGPAFATLGALGAKVMEDVDLGPVDLPARRNACRDDLAQLLAAFAPAHVVAAAAAAPDSDELMLLAMREALSLTLSALATPLLSDEQERLRFDAAFAAAIAAPSGLEARRRGGLRWAAEFLMRRVGWEALQAALMPWLDAGAADESPPPRVVVAACNGDVAMAEADAGGSADTGACNADGDAGACNGHAMAEAHACARDSDAMAEPAPPGQVTGGCGGEGAAAAAASEPNGMECDAAHAPVAAASSDGGDGGAAAAPAALCHASGEAKAGALAANGCASGCVAAPLQPPANGEHCGAAASACAGNGAGLDAAANGCAAIGSTASPAAPVVIGSAAPAGLAGGDADGGGAGADEAPAAPCSNGRAVSVPESAREAVAAAPAGSAGDACADAAGKGEPAPTELEADTLAAAGTQQRANGEAARGSCLVTNKLVTLIKCLWDSCGAAEVEQQGSVSAEEDRWSAMVFVKTRLGCLVVTRLMRSLPALRARFKACEFTGTTLMDEKKQAAAVARFSRGELNVLVCTNVGSEGMDFRRCSLVVAADPPPNVIHYIQCRGRARKPGSSYILMHEQGTAGVAKLAGMAEALCSQVQHLSDAHRAALAALPPTDGADALSATTTLLAAATSPPGPAAPSDAAGAPLVTPAGARATARIAPVLLAEVCARLPGTDAYNIMQPHYLTRGFQTTFVATVFLPSNSGLRDGVPNPTPCASADCARQQAALAALRLLHERGVLDDHLHLRFDASRPAQLKARTVAAFMPTRNVPWPLAGGGAGAGAGPAAAVETAEGAGAAQQQQQQQQQPRQRKPPVANAPQEDGAAAADANNTAADGGGGGCGGATDGVAAAGDAAAAAAAAEGAPNGGGLDGGGDASMAGAPSATQAAEAAERAARPPGGGTVTLHLYAIVAARPAKRAAVAAAAQRPLMASSAAITGLKDWEYCAMAAAGGPAPGGEGAASPAPGAAGGGAPTARAPRSSVGGAAEASGESSGLAAARDPHSGLPGGVAPHGGDACFGVLLWGRLPSGLPPFATHCVAWGGGDRLMELRYQGPLVVGPRELDRLRRQQVAFESHAVLPSQLFGYGPCSCLTVSQRMGFTQLHKDGDLTGAGERDGDGAREADGDDAAAAAPAATVEAQAPAAAPSAPHAAMPESQAVTAAVAAALDSGTQPPEAPAYFVVPLAGAGGAPARACAGACVGAGSGSGGCAGDCAARGRIDWEWLRQLSRGLMPSLAVVAALSQPTPSARTSALADAGRHVKAAMATGTPAAMLRSDTWRAGAAAARAGAATCLVGRVLVDHHLGRLWHCVGIAPTLAGDPFPEQDKAATYVDYHRETHGADWLDPGLPLVALRRGRGLSHGTALAPPPVRTSTHGLRKRLADGSAKGAGAGDAEDLEYNTLLPLDLLWVMPLDRVVWTELHLLPSVLWRVESLLVQHQLALHLAALMAPHVDGGGFALPHPGLLLAAASPRMVHEPDCDNDRLEFLGDSLLKFLVSNALLQIMPTAPEGELTVAKVERVCNARLAEVADAQLLPGRPPLSSFLRLHGFHQATSGPCSMAAAAAGTLTNATVAAANAAAAAARRAAFIARHAAEAAACGHGNGGSGAASPASSEEVEESAEGSGVAAHTPVANGTASRAAAAAGTARAGPVSFDGVGDDAADAADTAAAAAAAAAAAPPPAKKPRLDADAGGDAGAGGDEPMGGVGAGEGAGQGEPPCLVAGVGVTAASAASADAGADGGEAGGEAGLASGTPTDKPKKKKKKAAARGSNPVPEELAPVQGKRKADLIEALIAASYLAAAEEEAVASGGGRTSAVSQAGLLASALLCERLGLLPAGSAPLACKAPIYVAAGDVPAQRVEGACRLAQRTAAPLGRYVFTQPLLLQQALTHVSVLGAPSYQRLEFLGDALLDLLVSLHLLMRPEARKLTPGVLTQVRSSSVQNRRLAEAVATSGLYSHIRIHSVALRKAILAYVAALLTQPGDAAGSAPAAAATATASAPRAGAGGRRKRAAAAGGAAAESPAAATADRAPRGAAGGAATAAGAAAVAAPPRPDCGVGAGGSRATVEATEAAAPLALGGPWRDTVWLEEWVGPALAEQEEAEGADAATAAAALADGGAGGEGEDLCPKVLADVAESLLAAVFIDTCGDWERSWEVVRRAGLVSVEKLMEDAALMPPLPQSDDD